MSSLVPIRELVKQQPFAFSSAMKRPRKALPTSMDKMFAVASNPFVILVIVHNKIAAWTFSPSRMVSISWPEYEVSLPVVFRYSYKISVPSSCSIPFFTIIFINWVVEPNDACTRHSLWSVCCSLTSRWSCWSVWSFLGPPLVAILDEPTTGVDPDARQQMQEIFLNAVKAKLTIILTSHSMDEW